LRQADPTSKESYKLFIRYIIFIINSEWELAREPNPSRLKKKKKKKKRRRRKK
jgi:hypothetical protein